MKKLLALLALPGMLWISSCSDDEPITAAPEVSAPAAATVTSGATVNVSFPYIAIEGFASSSVTETGGSTSVTTDGVVGETSGDITVSFTAGEAGAGSVTLTITDSNGNTGSATAVLTITETEATPVISVRGAIEGTVNWTADNIYQLETRVTVVDGSTLNIAPGTVIKGNPGQAAAATSLLVARGGTLNAQGTAALPIIFTSTNDPIDPADVAAGNYASTTNPAQTGLWGGIIILGKAPITAKSEDASGEETTDLAELQIEGIPASDENGLYGGDDEMDDSGTITYVSIRHGGTNIGAGNEINGLTLGGVGSGTNISNIEVVGNADDGIEFFGGNVSVDGALIWNSFDDSMDTDQDWTGSVTNFIIIAPNTGSAFELDGPEGDRTRGENHMFSEGVIYGGADIDAIVDWDDNTNATLTNLYFFGITAGRIDSFGGNGAEASSNWETDLTDNSGGFFDGVDEGVITYGVAVDAKSYGPSAADFAWTWAGNSGTLTDLGL